MYPPVRNKRDFVKRYKNGEFGNAAPTWDSVELFLQECDLRQFPKNQKFHLRNRVPGGDTYYHQTYEDIRKRPSLSKFYVSAMAPDQHLILQGEVRRSVRGLELRYTRVRLPMRDALLKEETTVHGLTALKILEESLNPISSDWLGVLLERYPDHIVEFSTYSVEWGTLKGYNTVFWEIRPDRGFGSNLSSYTEVY